MPLASQMALVPKACLSYQPRLWHLSRGTRRDRITLYCVPARGTVGKPITHPPRQAHPTGEMLGLRGAKARVHPEHVPLREC